MVSALKGKRDLIHQQIMMMMTIVQNRSFTRFNNIFQRVRLFLMHSSMNVQKICIAISLPYLHLIQMDHGSYTILDEILDSNRIITAVLRDWNEKLIQIYIYKIRKESLQHLFKTERFTRFKASFQEVVLSYISQE